MDEAEALSDRILIMKKGEIQCIGDSLSLKEKYVEFYAVSLTVERGFERICEKRLKKKIDNRIKIEVFNGNILKFEVGFEGVKKVFEMLKEEDGLKGKVVDWEFSQPSLDDVFMNLAQEENSTT